MTVGSKAQYAALAVGDVADLVASQPLAWIITGAAADLAATPLPVQLRVDAKGVPSELVGHFGRSNPQVAVLAADPNALVVLMGPHGYVSPSWFSNRSQAPTWNYVCAAFHVRILLEDSPDAVAERLQGLIEASEAGRTQPWTTYEMGSRYASLSRGVVGFRAPVLSWRASFKLGQDEDKETFHEIVTGLRANRQPDLAGWMERFAERRGVPPSSGHARPSLDPDLAQFAATTTEDARRLDGGEPIDIAKRRRSAEQVRQPWAAGGPRIASTRDVDVPGPRPAHLRIYEAATTDRPVLFYVHGGGWTLFSLATHDRLMREYSHRAEVTVVGIEYALAPERQYPYALEQCIDAVRWLRSGGADLGIDKTHLLLGGDSAGANLAIATALALREEGEGSALAGLVLNYGAFDVDIDLDSRERFGTDEDLLTATEMDQYWRNYLRGADDRRDPLACPLRADLDGLPPTLLIVPECDLLTQQSHAMAQRLRLAAVPTTEHVYPGAPHSFLEAISISSIASQALSDTASWINQLVRR